MAVNPVPTRTLDIITEKASTESIARCTGRITAETASQLREIARNLVSESKSVVLDFTGVDYLDSSGLGMIVGLMVSAKRSGCKLRLVNLTPRVREIFTMSRVLEALQGHEEYLGVTPD